MPRPSDRYALAGGKLMVSPVCLGEVRDPRVIPAAYDAGFNFFFLSADMHWPLYEDMRRGLEMLFERPGARDNVVVGVVSYMTQPVFCYSPFMEVVKSVSGLGHIDVSIIGGAYAADFLPRLREYQEHQRIAFQGVRATGASFHDREAAMTAINHGLVDVAFLRYNPAHRGAAHEVFPHLRRDGSTLIYNFKSMVGYANDARITALGLSPKHWRPQMTDYYRFALSRPEIDGLLVALRGEAQVGALVDALARGPLSEGEVQYLSDLADLSKAADAG